MSEFLLEFPARYELRPLSDIPDKSAARVFHFPRARMLDEGLDPAAGPVIEVLANDERWVGVFHGDYVLDPRSQVPPYVIGWPDEESFCVVYRGVGSLVQADDPGSETVIDCYPICGVHVAAAQQMVLFASFQHLVAYDHGGILWKSSPVAEDDVQILGVEGDEIRLSGFFGWPDERPEFTVDLRTGKRRGPA